MSRFDSVKAFGKRCETELSRLDIAILNAGVPSVKYVQTVDGWEEVLQVRNTALAQKKTDTNLSSINQVNVLSTGLLGMLLLSKLSRPATEVHSGSGTQLKPHLCIAASDGELEVDFLWSR